MRAVTLITLTTEVLKISLFCGRKCSHDESYVRAYNSFQPFLIRRFCNILLIDYFTHKYSIMNIFPIGSDSVFHIVHYVCLSYVLRLFLIKL